MWIRPEHLIRCAISIIVLEGDNNSMRASQIQWNVPSCRSTSQRKTLLLLWNSMENYCVPFALRSLILQHGRSVPSIECFLLFDSVQSEQRENIALRIPNSCNVWRTVNLVRTTAATPINCTFYLQPALRKILICSIVYNDGACCLLRANLDFITGP